MARVAKLEWTNNELIVGTNVLAYLLNPDSPYSRETISQWVKKGMPYTTKGKTKEFNYTEVYKWLSENENDLGMLKAAKLREEIKNTKKAAELKDIKIKEEKKQLISVEDVSKSQIALFEMLKNADTLIYTRATDPNEKKLIDKINKQRWDMIQDKLEAIYKEQQ